MLSIEYKEILDKKFYSMIDSEFNKFTIKNGVACSYMPFILLQKKIIELLE